MFNAGISDPQFAFRTRHAVAFYAVPVNFLVLLIFNLIHDYSLFDV